MVHLDELPRRRVVVRFDVRDARPPNRLWLVLGTGGREVCVTGPGYGDDAVVTSDLGTLVAWHCGRLTLGQAQRAGMQVVATPSDERMLDAWGRLSPFADIAPAPGPTSRDRAEPAR
jgi:hypothetical protein